MPQLQGARKKSKIYLYVLISMYNYRRVACVLILFVFFLKFWNYFLYYRIAKRDASLIKYPFHPKNKPLRVLCYNVYLRPPMISHCHGDYKNERLNMICKILPYFDIILFQEIYTCLNFRCSHIINKASQFGFNHHYCTYSPTLISRHLANNALLILSRYPILARDYINFSNYGSYDSVIEKGCDYVKIGLTPDLSIHTFNTHLQSSYAKNDDRAKKIRLDQLRELRKFIDSKMIGKEPIICGGDFNINVYDQEEKKTLYNMMYPYVDTHEDCQTPTILVPYDKQNKENTDVTVLCKKCCNKLRDEKNLTFDKQRLDYIFYDKGHSRLQLQKKQVIPFFVKNPSLDFHLLSDHFALYSEFKVN